MRIRGFFILGRRTMHGSGKGAGACCDAALRREKHDHGGNMKQNHRKRFSIPLGGNQGEGNPVRAPSVPYLFTGG